jgi:hypothetical protein
MVGADNLRGPADLCKMLEFGYSDIWRISTNKYIR